MQGVKTDQVVNITINNVEVQVPQGELVVEAAKRIAAEVPIFCYHPRMEPVGMCRMCLVEIGFRQTDGSVRMMPKPQTACTLPVSEGMVIYTDSESIHKDRRSVLEFLLINHPLDCPTCDRGGECPLQNNTLFYGPSTSRYIELKRHLPKAYPLSKHVTLDLERCIQCSRCTRFTEEISGDGQLAFHFRGAETQPNTFEMRDFDSKFSGNTIEICPVGALTSTDYRFRARPWDLEASPGVCTLCSNGCNVWFDHRAGKFVRINGRTHEGVNEEWTCDRGKFGHNFYNSPKRLKYPLIRKEGGFVRSGWAEVYEEIIRAFKPGGKEVAGLVRATASNEGLYLMQKLFRAFFKSNNLDHRWTKYLESSEDQLEFKVGINQVQSSIASFEKKKSIFIFGTSLSDEAPILYLRVRKAWYKHKAKVVVAGDKRTDADQFASSILRYKPGTEAIVVAGLLRAVIELKGGELPSRVAQKLEKYSVKYVSEVTGVCCSRLEQAARELLEDHLGIIVNRNIMNQPDGQEVLELLSALSIVTEGEMNCYSMSANGQGAKDLGILPDMLPGGFQVSDERALKKFEDLYGTNLSSEVGLDTGQILRACAEGSVRALWVMNADPMNDFHDRDLAIKAMENLEFLVYQGFLESETMEFASVVLPMRAPAEQDGTYTNLERRVQRMRPAIAPPGEAKSSWRIFSELMMRLKPSTPYFNASEVMNAIAETIPMFSGSCYSNLDGEGAFLKPEKPLLKGLDFLQLTLERLDARERGI